MEDVLKLKGTKNLEVEFRLGRKTKQKFDTNVGLDTYKKVVRRLWKYPDWEDVSEESVELYYGESDLRVTYNPETEEQVCIKKSLIKNIDVVLPDKQYDVRIGLSTETPSEYDQTLTFGIVRKRERVSFLRKNLRIDCSVVEGVPVDGDSEDKKTYHIELEILNPETLNEVIFSNHYAKIFDVLKICT
jgi:hypothetical protein